MTDEELLATVKEMRDLQHRFFGGEKTADVVGAAKRLERAVDDEFKRREKPKGKTLFDMIDEFDEPITERQLT